METLIVLIIIFGFLSCIGMGLIFKKLNLGFVKGIIPFYNKIVLINRYSLPPFHLIFVFIPLVCIYTNYKIYKRLCSEFNKDSLYVIELTMFPFVYNFFLGFELEQRKQEVVESNNDEEKKEEYDASEYTWQPKQVLKSNTVYKASRNNFSGSINKSDEIIESKKLEKKDSVGKKQCSNCGAKVSDSSKVCPVCGSTL